PLPAFDYNIGRCSERLERWAAAAAAYERYLAAQPDAEDAVEIRQRIDILKARAGKQRPKLAQRPLPAGTKPADVPAPTLVKRSRRPAAWGPWLSLGVGLVLGGTGTYFSVRTLDDHVSFADRRTAATVANVTFPLAGVAAAAAIGL